MSSVVSAITKKEDAARMEDIFSCYDKMVKVRATEALGDVVEE